MILAEAPSYVGALGTFAAYQAEVVHVAMDEHGLNPPQALRQALLTLRAAGKRVKFLYTIPPNFNNPAGLTQPLERRKEILAIADELDLLIVEDNPYGLLTIDGQDPLPAMRSLDDTHVVYLGGSFSKTFAPGLRVGWVLAPHGVREKLVLAQESATLAPSVFSQFVVSTYLAHWDWRAQLDTFRAMYRERRDAMLRGLTEHMPPGSTWTHPTGGFFVWLTLPRASTPRRCSPPRRLGARGVHPPGTAFYADGMGSRNIRLSYCFPPPRADHRRHPAPR